ncbi:MAG: hypothetical protein ACQETH_17745 [Candidatus Rifleibacteriota bacterium]
MTEENSTAVNNKLFWFCLVGFILLTIVFFKNAWVCDDAYINFRSIEQLFAGNGPNWNPHERVQVYTSPLWYWLLAFARLISADPFFNAIILSFIFFLLLCFSLYCKLSLFAAGTTLFLLAASNSFVDFSTSGLENILAAFLLINAFIYSFKAVNERENNSFKWRAVFYLSMLPLCRHDLVLLMLPLGAYLLLNGYQRGKNRVAALVLMFLPLILWTIFSLIYYGAAFPNTAYAKIFTGIPRAELIGQGLKYCWVTLAQDPITIVLILAAIFMPFFVKEKHTRFVSVALILNFLYVIWVGGDFMRGRFFFAPYVLAAITIAIQLDSFFSKVCNKNVCYGVIVFYIVYLVLFPFTPLNTGLSYTNFNLSYGIADERGYYFDVCSLYSYLYSEPEKVFPDFEWSHLGRQIARSKVNYLENDFNGMLGYWAGTRPIIVDRLGLADPLLARLPVSDKENWRIGHFKREVPDEYRESIEKGKNLLKEPLNNLYRLIWLAAKSDDLLSKQRIKAVIKLNLGLY